MWGKIDCLLAAVYNILQLARLKVQQMSILNILKFSAPWENDHFNKIFALRLVMAFHK